MSGLFYHEPFEIKDDKLCTLMLFETILMLKLQREI